MGKVKLTPPPPTPPAWTVGDRLRKARERTGLDQESFAAELGVSRGTVSNYERSRTTHRRAIVLRTWAVATGVPLEWLLDDDPTHSDFLVAATGQPKTTRIRKVQHRPTVPGPA